MTNDENERYVLEIGKDIVAVWDNKRMEPAQTFTGPDRLLAATAELNRLNDRDAIDYIQKRPTPVITTVNARAYAVAVAAMGERAEALAVTPSVFLAETLPAVARRQRLESQLAEVTEIRESLAASVVEMTANLERAMKLERRITDALARPLSATLPDENAPEVVVDTLIAEGLESAAEALAEQKVERAPWIPGFSNAKRKCHRLPETRYVDPEGGSNNVALKPSDGDPSGLFKPQPY